jgi:hypothetical protein
MWFVGAGAIGPFYGKLWLLLAIWAASVVAAAFFMKIPIVLPLLSCVSLFFQFFLLDSWSSARQYPLDTLSSNFGGILLAGCALTVYRYRPRSSGTEG